MQRLYTRSSRKKWECTIFKAFKSPKHALNRRLVKKREDRVLCEMKCANLVYKQGKDTSSNVEREREIHNVVIKRKEEEIIDKWIDRENIRKDLKP